MGDGVGICVGGGVDTGVDATGKIMGGGVGKGVEGTGMDGQQP